MKTNEVLQQFADAMIARMETMKNSQYKQAWLTTSYGGDAKNLSGRVYNGCNQFFLLLFTEVKGWATPIYATFKQYKELGASVNKGEKALPAVFWSPLIFDKQGNKVTTEQYNAMSKAGRDGCRQSWFLKSYAVFNIDQTNLREVNPDAVDKITGGFKGFDPKTDTEGMYANEAFDTMISSNGWVCPIVSDKSSDRAFYNMTSDRITCPMKAQYKREEMSEQDVFVAGQSYYSTILHEMAHSTGAKTRLARLESSRFGSKEYGKEELVAELSSALVGNQLGFSSKVSNDNATYLNSWIKTIKEQPQFIVSVMADVSKAVAMINDKLGIE